ncbi:MAG: 5-oxoprolinase subunit PxpA [Bacteroidota bacterium]
MDNYTIDLNCDMGESYGRYTIGNDAAIFPYITSCNIACGYHGGDPMHIEKTIQLALENNVQIGAHPSYPDLMGFGRRKMEIPLNELSSIVKYQVAALKGLTESHGGRLAYVKPHGALYNSLSKNEEEATCVIKAILSIDQKLAIMGLAGSLVKKIVENHGGRFIAEAFADRRYEANGHLMSRRKAGAVLHEPAVIAQQVLDIIKHNRVEGPDGQPISLSADSICIHGDNPKAVPILAHLHHALQEAGVQKVSF